LAKLEHQLQQGNSMLDALSCELIDKMVWRPTPDGRGRCVPRHAGQERKIELAPYPTITHETTVVVPKP